MIEERALVLDNRFDECNFDTQLARVKVQRTSACESCSLKSGCGQSTLTKLSSNQCLELDVENTLNAKPGDDVIIAIPEAGLMSASIRVYLIPLVLMVLGAILGSVIYPVNDTWTILFSCIGIVIGFAWARFSSQKQTFDPKFLPKITKISHPAPVITIQNSLKN